MGMCVGMCGGVCVWECVVCGGSVVCGLCVWECVVCGVCVRECGSVVCGYVVCIYVVWVCVLCVYVVCVCVVCVWCVCGVCVREKGRLQKLAHSETPCVWTLHKDKHGTQHIPMFIRIGLRESRCLANGMSIV